jgi:peptide/nickel transport system substrate-binding protein
MMSRRQSLLASLIVVALGLTAATSPGQAGPSAADTLIMASPGTVEQIDPNYAGGSFTAQTVVANVYDQLTQYATSMSPDGYLVSNTEKIIGNVAQSYDMTLGSKRIVYRIRGGLKFHDGTPLDANAVKFTLDRIAALKGLGYFYVNFAGAPTTDSFELVNAETLVVHLQRPNPLAMKLLTLENIAPINPGLVHQHATADDPWGRKWLAVNAAGSGPFVVEELLPASEVVLVRNDAYWKGPAKLKRVIIKIIPSVADRVLALQRGSVDMITDVPPKDIASLREKPSVKVISVHGRKFFVMGMNVDTPPFNNSKVRQAMCYAVPYDTIINGVFRGYGSRMRSPIPRGTPTYTEKFGLYDTDLVKAKALLAEAGFPDGFKSTLMIQAGVEEVEEAAVWIKSNLQKIGVNIDIEILPLGAFLTKARAKGHAMYIFSHMHWVNDPFYTFGVLYQTGLMAGYTGYSNNEVDRLITDNIVSTNVSARAQASERVQQIVMNEAPFCFLAQANDNVAMRKNVQGFYASFDVTHVARFYTMYKEP